MPAKNKMKVIAIIPARMGSTRFPGKPLFDIHGLPMIEHIRKRVALTRSVSGVIVATCDREIFDAVKAGGGKAVMTSPSHQRCTDRIIEASLSVEADIVINVQGDEPMVRPEMLDSVVAPLLNEPGITCTNLISEINSDEEFNSSNVVKTVCDTDNNVIYFSREPIPSVHKASGLPYKRYKQLGIIAFRKDFLLLFSKLPQTPLEIVESVDMLRAIEHGYKIRAVLTSSQAVGVDTPQDLERVRGLMKNDDLMPLYIKK